MRWLPQAPASLRYTVGAVAILAVIGIVDIVRGDPITGGILLGILIVFVGPILLLIVLATRANRRAPPPASPDEPGANGRVHHDRTPDTQQHDSGPAGD